LSFLADVIFTVKEIKHETFTREGDNLKIHSEVPLLKALVGYSMEVKTLDGRLLRIPINDTIT
jgi:DnaJ family protein B protein 13